MLIEYVKDLVVEPWALAILITALSLLFLELAL